ncbi:MAG TPA: ABC transporter substrate-binding protein [Candidatus Dormibacteraeota bacterium]|jgi:peptide/nickel transport system substrate-binding protein|nr:ABC transporter substrate-binding protein [Candidatus Dormibacteraeota bacterium]
MTTHYSDNELDPKDFLDQTRLSRRQAIAAGAGVSAAAVGLNYLSSCMGAQTPLSPVGDGKTLGKSAEELLASNLSVGGTPRAQTVVTDQTTMTVFNSFNYFIPNGSDYFDGFGQVCTEFLWYLNVATGKLVPWLATGWEYNSDHTQFTMHLNPKAHWNDGMPFTSKDVGFSLDMLQKNATLLNNNPNTTGELTSYTTPDDHTIVMNLNVTDPRYHYNYICGIVAAFYVMPQHIWASQDPTSFKFNPPIMTGPYKLYNVLANDLVVTWQKDPNYWNIANMNCKPEFAVWRSASTDLDVAFEQFKTGVTDYGSDYTHVHALIKGGFKNAEILTKFLDPCERAILINTKSTSAGGALKDYRMRWVISMLLDRERIANDVWVPATEPGVFPWAAYPGNKKWDVPSIAAKYPLKYNPAKAEKLLDQIGAKKHSNGKRYYKGHAMSLQVITGTLASAGDEYSIGQLLAEALTKVGIPSTVKYLGSSVLNEKQGTGEFDLLSQWLCGELIDPYQLYYQFQSKFALPIGKLAANANEDPRLTDPTFDKAVSQLGKLSPTASEATPYFHSALNRWFHDMPAVPTIQTLYTQQFNTTYWKNWPTNSNIYTVPDNWWGQWLFVLGKIQPAGGS